MNTSGVVLLLMLTGLLLPAARVRSAEPSSQTGQETASSPEGAAGGALARRRDEQLKAAAQYRPFTGFSFVDETEVSGITFEHNVVDDAGKNWIPSHYNHGNAVAVADVDGDGLLDLYFLNQLGRNYLARNAGGGKFQDWTDRAGVGLEDRICVAAAFADFDNDGDPDLFVTTVRHGNVLFENTGGGKFKDITRKAGVEYSGHSSGAFFFDYNRDGLLDLFVCNVGVYTSNEKRDRGDYKGLADAFAGHLRPERTEQSLLYQNLGGGKFKEISREVGLVDSSWSGDASFFDANQDGFPDVYVLNMQGDDHFYENRQGTNFVDKTAAYFRKTPWGAMGIKVLDYNLDGLPDLYLVDMRSDMTDAQTKQLKSITRSSLEKQKSEKWCTANWTEEYLQGASNNIFGNAFYQGTPGGRFIEVSDSIGAETYWPWGCSVGDLNADGYEDIFVTAGMGYPFRYAINSLLLNSEGQKFVDAEFVVGIEPRAGWRKEKTAFALDCSGVDKDHPLCTGQRGRKAVKGALSSRSSAILDLDGDGDLDLVTNEMNDRPQILVSNLSGKRPVRFLKVKLKGVRSNRDGIGATVRLHSGGRIQTRWNDGKSGYLAQSSIPLYFGLGNDSKADRIEIVWPDGGRQVISGEIAINTLIEVTEAPR